MSGPTARVTTSEGSDANAGPRTAGDREFIILVIALMACGALAIDTILPAFADVRADFGMPADSTRVGWLVTAFFLGLAVGPWLYGPASDRFGRRRPLQAGLVLYVLSAVVAALATSWTVMVAARFVWGLGAAGPRSLSVAMVRDRYSGDAMARLMSVIMAVFLLVPILAPAVGAGLIAVLPWRAVYWLPAVVAIALLVWTRRLPETLTPERRRPFTVAAVGTACREVVSNRQTRAFTVAMTFLFGVMTTYLAGSEIVVGEVFGYGEWFPAFFGVIAVLLAISSLNNARLVQRIGLTRLVRRMSQVGVLTAWILVAVSLSAGGRPNFWLFTIALAGVIPVAQGLVPNCNTAAMQPLPHVAGTASAVIGTVTTAGGALLGGLATSAFDGTVRPFALAIAIFISIASALILLVATERA